MSGMKGGFIATTSLLDFRASFLSSAGFSENENAEVEHWDNALTKHAKNRGIASVIIDHTPHDGDRSRGAARKREVADVQWQVKKVQRFDRDTVGEVLLVNRKDREGWLPESLTFSLGGRFGRLVCERSSGTIETPGAADGLTPSERTVLNTLREEFALTGARAAEWQRATFARKVSRATHYRAVKKLVSPGVSRAHRVSLVDETYLPPDDTKSPKGDETTESDIDTPDAPRSHEVSNRSHETDETGTNRVVSSVSPPHKGETMRPDADTDHQEDRRKLTPLVRAVFEEERKGPAKNLPHYLDGTTSLEILTNSVLFALQGTRGEMGGDERRAWERAVAAVAEERRG